MVLLRPSSNALSKGEMSLQDAIHQLKDGQGQGLLGRFWEPHSQPQLACYPCLCSRRLPLLCPRQCEAHCPAHPPGWGVAPGCPVFEKSLLLLWQETRRRERHYRSVSTKGAQGVCEHPSSSGILQGRIFIPRFTDKGAMGQGVWSPDGDSMGVPAGVGLPLP